MLFRSFHSIPAGELPDGFSADDLTPSTMKHLPAELHSEVVSAYAQAMAPTFLYLVPIAAIGFILTLFLRDRRLSTEAGLVARGELSADEIHDGRDAAAST